MSLVKGHSLPGWHPLNLEFLFYLHTGRILEGYWKVNKSPFRVHWNAIAKTPAHWKGARRIPEEKVPVPTKGLGYFQYSHFGSRKHKSQARTRKHVARRQVPWKPSMPSQSPLGEFHGRCENQKIQCGESHQCLAA